MNFYRVFPHDRDAAPTEPGGALYVPESRDGRIGNPDWYRVLYVTGDPRATIAETLGRLTAWREASFVRASGHRLTLATFSSPYDLRIADLDRVDEMKKLGVERASEVLTRDRARTQRLALTIFEGNQCDGISWPSFYNPEWHCFGIWTVDAFETVRLLPLSVDEPIVDETAAIIRRQIFRARR